MIADATRIPIESLATWLAMRQQDVTESDVAALFGKSPYKTMLGLFAEKAGLVPASVEENDAMKRGRYMEHAILAACSEHPALAHGAVDRTALYWRSPSLRLGATPDASLETGEASEPIDAKSVASYVFDQSWASGPPLHIQLQVLVQAMLMGAPRGWVACALMTPEMPLHVFEVPRHEKAERMILDAVAAFWKAVEAGDAPDPTAGDHAVLTALFPQASRPEPLDWSADDEIQVLLNRRAEICDIVKPLEGEKAEIDAKIKASMGAHGLALAPGWKVTWTERKAYVANVPASRVLRVTALNLDQEEAA